MELDSSLPRLSIQLLLQLSTLILPTLTTVTHLEEFTIMAKLRISQNFENDQS